MKIFSFKQYIKCIHTLRLNAVLQLAEDNASYTLERNNDKKLENDKYQDYMNCILEDTAQVSKLINGVNLKENISINEIIKYNNQYINKKYKKKIHNYIYKVKNREVYYLFEYAPYITTSTTYRLLNTCIDIIQELCKNNKDKVLKESPYVVPIVIYYRKYKGNNSDNRNLRKKEISSIVFERNNIKFNYNLIRIDRVKKFLNN